MLRHAARGLCRRGLTARTISTTAMVRQDDEALPKAFTDRFTKLVPSTMAPPNFPTDFLPKDQKEVKEAPSTVPDKLTFNFYLPHEQIAKARKVRQCTCICCYHTRQPERLICIPVFQVDACHLHVFACCRWTWYYFLQLQEILVPCLVTFQPWHSYGLE